MELKIGKFYKLCEETPEIGEEEDFRYYMCVADQKEFYVLQELETYVQLNKLEMEFDMIDDIDEYFKDLKELDKKHFKKLNPIECLYYKNKEIEVKIERSTRKFNLS